LDDVHGECGLAGVGGLHGANPIHPGRERERERKEKERNNDCLKADETTISRDYTHNEAPTLQQMVKICFLVFFE
jgi:hypothetical protein